MNPTPKMATPFKTNLCVHFSVILTWRSEYNILLLFFSSCVNAAIVMRTRSNLPWGMASCVGSTLTPIALGGHATDLEEVGCDAWHAYIITNSCSGVKNSRLLLFDNTNEELTEDEQQVSFVADLGWLCYNYFSFELRKYFPFVFLK